MKILNFDSAIATVSAGTASVPSISFAGDPNTGIYSPGADQLAISTGGSERLRITSAGLVGVGTSTPGHTIDVAGTGRHFSTTTDGASLYLSKTNSGTAHQGGNKVYFTNSGPAATARNDGTLIGAIQFQASQPTSGSLQNCGAIEITADGTQSGIYTPTKISFSTANNISSGANAVAMTIDSSQRVGIGTTPDSRLHVQGLGSASGYTSANNAGVKVDFGTGNNGVINLVGGSDLGIYRSNSSGAYDVGIGFGDNSNRILRFDTAGTERARIDSSGRLLVGTSSARSNFYNTSATANVQIETAATDPALSVVGNSTAGFAPAIVLGLSNSNTLGSNTLVANAQELGRLVFQGNDGTEFVQAAQIQAFVDGTPGANDMPGRLVFSTTADGASSPTERMRIDNAGTATFSPASATSAQIINVSNNVTAVSFRISGTQYGYIQVATSGTTYSTSSDYRIKENVSPVTDGITRLQQLKPSRFNFITDPDKTVDGFIAHEVQDIVPEAITGEKDAVDDDGNPIYQGIDQSKLVPLLTAALQEAVAKIESLEARLTVAGL